MVFITVGFTAFSQRIMESLDRGLVAVKTEDNGVFVSWRKFATDASDIAFNIYRDGTLVNDSPISDVSNYLDAEGTKDDYYYLEIVDNSGVVGISEATVVWENQYKEIPLQAPDETYASEDCSIADLDGDGEMEIVVKMENSHKDNSQSGYTDPVYLQAYELNGELLWSVCLGVNIRAGSHYTQFMVYDLDGDGKAEIACKTAPGTQDATGAYLSVGPAASDDDAADYRNSDGYILEGPEYLTVFNGETGAEITTVDYVPGRGTISEWGDSYGNRCDRFLACVAYLDGTNPSLVMCRGYYAKSTLAAWDFADGTLTQRWLFNTDDDLIGKDGNAYSLYAGQGAHSLSVGDVDGDGKDEIVYGAMAVDDDGQGLWTTGNNHGDATHLGDFDADRNGLEYFMPSESASSTNKVTQGLVDAVWFAKAESGEIIWSKNVGEVSDIGRGMADDVTDDNPGCEFWAYGKAYSPATDRYSLGFYNDEGTEINESSEWPSINFACWWDGDLTREILSGTTIQKWSTTDKNAILETGDYCSSNNSTKAVPSISGDILGDWREEVIWRTTDNKYLRIYTTTETTTHGLYTLLHDPQYRLALTWQNVAYNQPPHTSFYLGADMPAQPDQNITMINPDVDPFIQIVDPVINYELELGRYVYINVQTVGIVGDVTIKDGDVTLATLTEAPYIVKIEGLETGVHSIVASGNDAESNLIESDVHTITVDEGYPHVTFTSPEDEKIYELSESIPLSVDAYDSDGTIASVVFYFNDEEVVTLTEEPYSTTVDNPGYGTYEIKAVVTDDLGNSTETEIHTINVGLLTFIQSDLSEIGFCGFITEGWIEYSNEGYTGTGYANTDNAVGEGVNWTVTIPEDGSYTFLWRYAASSDRPGNLFLNGTQEGETLTFASTGGWTTWITESTDVSLTAGNYEISLVATTSGGLGNIDYFEIISQTASAAVALDCDSYATGVEDNSVEMSADNITIYPNPASETLYVKVLNDISTSGDMMIYDLTGSLVKNDIYYTGENKFDISTLKKGIYLLKLSNNSGSFIQKLVVE